MKAAMAKTTAISNSDVPRRAGLRRHNGVRDDRAEVERAPMNVIAGGRM
jgi:hypothetical protein